MESEYGALYSLMADPSMRATAFRTQALPRTFGLVSIPLTHMFETGSLCAYVAGPLDLDVGAAHLAGSVHDIAKGPFGHLGEEELRAHTGDEYKHDAAGEARLEELGITLALDIPTVVRRAVGSHSTEIDSEEFQSLPPLTKILIFADTFCHISSDTRDALDLGIVGRNDLSQSVVSALGSAPVDWAHALADDLIANSQPGLIALSDVKLEALLEQRAWLAKHVYARVERSKWAQDRRRFIRAVLHHLSCTDGRNNTPKDRSAAVLEVARLTDDQVLSLVEEIAPDDFYPDLEYRPHLVAAWDFFEEVRHD